MTHASELTSTRSAAVSQSALERAGKGLSHEQARTLIHNDMSDARQRMSGTLDQLAERLNPNRFKRQLQNDIRDATIGRVRTMARDTAGRMNDGRTTMMDTVRENPIPAAMAAVGIGWLFMNRSRTSESRGRYATRRSSSRHQQEWALQERTGVAYGSGATGFAPENTAERAYSSSERWNEAGDWSRREGEREHEGAIESVKERAQQAGETVRERAEGAREMAMERTEQAKHRARELASTTREKSMNAGRATRERAMRMERRVEETYSENPLALGAAALALGFVAGMGAPGTRKEAELMGEASETFKERVKDELEDVKEKAQHVGSRALEETKEAAKEEMRT